MPRMGPHSIAVVVSETRLRHDVADLEVADLRRPEPGAVGDAERRTVLEPRPRGRRQQGRNLLLAQDRRQLPRLGAELHVPLHLLAPAGHAEEEAQRHDARVERRRHDAGVRHVKLVGAQVLRLGGVGGPPQERGEVLDRPDASLLRLLAHTADPHVFDHPLAQRRGPLLRHRNLLSEEGKDPDRQTERPNAKRNPVRSTSNDSHMHQCRGAASSMGQIAAFGKWRP